MAPRAAATAHGEMMLKNSHACVGKAVRLEFFDRPQFAMLV
jgi:hypothetical protein